MKRYFNDYLEFVAGRNFAFVYSNPFTKHIYIRKDELFTVNKWLEMDKRWKNLILIIVAIVVVFTFLNIILNMPQENTLTTNPVDLMVGIFENNGYTVNSFIEEKSMNLNIDKAKLIKQDLLKIDFDSKDQNLYILKTFYVGVIDLKIHEKQILEDVQNYTYDDELLCLNIDDLLDADMNFSSLNSEYESLEEVRSIYLFNFDKNIVPELNSSRYSLAPEEFSSYVDYVFGLCAAGAIEEVLEE